MIVVSTVGFDGERVPLRVVETRQAAEDLAEGLDWTRVEEILFDVFDENGLYADTVFHLTDTLELDTDLWDELMDGEEDDEEAE